jgi:hypothetical protein
MTKWRENLSTPPLPLIYQAVLPTPPQQTLSVIFTIRDSIKKELEIFTRTEQKVKP